MVRILLIFFSLNLTCFATHSGRINEFRCLVEVSGEGPLQSSTIDGTHLFEETALRFIERYRPHTIPRTRSIASITQQLLRSVVRHKDILGRIVDIERLYVLLENIPGGRDLEHTYFRSRLVNLVHASVVLQGWDIDHEGVILNKDLLGRSIQIGLSVRDYFQAQELEDKSYAKALNNHEVNGSTRLAELVRYSKHFRSMRRLFQVISTQLSVLDEQLDDMQAFRNTFSNILEMNNLRFQSAEEGYLAFLATYIHLRRVNQRGLRLTHSDLCRQFDTLLVRHIREISKLSNESMDHPNFRQREAIKKLKRQGYRIIAVGRAGVAAALHLPSLEFLDNRYREDSADVIALGNDGEVVVVRFSRDASPESEKTILGRIRQYCMLSRTQSNNFRVRLFSIPDTAARLLSATPLTNYEVSP